jgi:fucose permease
MRALPVFLVFLAMGFGDAVGPFVSLAKAHFSLSNAVANLIPFTGLLMFGLLSVPMGVFQDRVGKKTVLLLGLVVGFAGLLNASFGLGSFTRFLLTILLMGICATLLQVAGNPIMRDVSAEGKYSRNLSLGQFVKAIGSLSGPLIPVVAHFFGLGWDLIFPIYALALLITILCVLTLRVNERRSEDVRPATVASCLALLGNGYAAMMVAAIFFYVGAEVAVNAHIPLYLHERYDVDIEKFGLLGTGLFFTALTIGRFFGGVLLNWMSPTKALLATTILSLASILGLFVPVQAVAVASFCLVGLGFANIFPLVFSITIDRMPQHTNALSGLMVSAIIGGAVLPLAMGFVADQSTVQMSFLVPLAAIGYTFVVAIVNLKSLPFSKAST